MPLFRGERSVLSAMRPTGALRGRSDSDFLPLSEVNAIANAAFIMVFVIVFTSLGGKISIVTNTARKQNDTLRSVQSNNLEGLRDCAT